MNRIRYFPYKDWNIAANYLKGAVIEASTDNVNYDEITIVDQTVHAGWNSYMPTTSNTYRYVRIRHSTVSNCKIAEIELIGNLFNDATVSNIVSHTWASTEFSDGFNTFTFNNAIEYLQAKTPVVTSVSPLVGDVFGNYDITLAGTNLDIGAADIMIDGIACVVQSASATTIVCTVGERSAIPSENTFTVSVGGNKAILHQKFMYVMRYSDPRTWGTDVPPIEGDLVYVPEGMTLYMDETTPQLEGIITLGGNLFFADEADMEIHAGIIVMNGG